MSSQNRRAKCSLSLRLRRRGASQGRMSRLLRCGDLCFRLYWGIQGTAEKRTCGGVAFAAQVAPPVNNRQVAGEICERLSCSQRGGAALRISRMWPSSISGMQSAACAPTTVSCSQGTIYRRIKGADQHLFIKVSVTRPAVPPGLRVATWLPALKPSTDCRPPPRRSRTGD
jgi:hypothetical protein